VWPENGERRAGHGVRHRLGVVVDTHVTRLSERLDLHEIPIPEIELDLMKVIPQEKWILFPTS